MRRILCVFSFLAVTALYANGGPVDQSLFLSAGDINIKNIKNIKDITILSEDLNIKFDDDYASVKVQYELRNDGKDVEVLYGFPVSVLPDDHIDTAYKETVRDYSIQLNDKILTAEARRVDETSEHKYYVDKNIIVKADILWHLSHFNLASGKTVKLNIDYKVKLQLDDWFSSKSPYPSYSNRVFEYVFKPAAGWGNGIVNKFKCTVDFEHINVGKGKIIKFKLFDIKFDGSNQYVIELENLNLRNSKNIFIEYNIDYEKLAKNIKARTIGKEHIINLKTSSDLKGNYFAKNLFDSNYSTCWAEGSEGLKEEWIEFELDGEYVVDNIYICNGYLKSKEIFNANAKPKTIVVVINDETSDWREILLPDRKFKDSYDFNVFKDADSIAGGGRPMKKIKLIIKDYYPGINYSDGCISEIKIVGRKLDSTK